MEEQRKLILITASKEMAARGIRAVTMDEIATRVGISKKTIYTYFEDKEEIVRAIFAAHFNGLFCGETNASGCAVEKLIKMKMLHAQRAQMVCPQFTEDLRRCYPALLSDYMAQQRAHAHKELGALLMHGQQEGDVRLGLDLDVVIDLLTELPLLVQQSERIANLGYPSERLCATLERLLIGGLLTEAGQAKAQAIYDTLEQETKTE